MARPHQIIMEPCKECVGRVWLKKPKVQWGEEGLDASNNEVGSRSKWSSPKKRVYNDCGNEYILVCCQPTLFKAIQDSSLCICVFWASHCSIACNERPKGQEDSVQAAMCCLGDVRRDSEQFKMSFHSTQRLLAFNLSNFFNYNIHGKRMPEILIPDQPNHPCCLRFWFGIPCDDNVFLFWPLFIKIDNHHYNGVKFLEPPVGLVVHCPPGEDRTNDGLDLAQGSPKCRWLHIPEQSEDEGLAAQPSDKVWSFVGKGESINIRFEIKLMQFYIIYLEYY